MSNPPGPAGSRSGISIAYPRPGIRCFHVRRRIDIALPDRKRTLLPPSEEELATNRLPAARVYCGAVDWEMISARRAGGDENVVDLGLRAPPRIPLPLRLDGADSAAALAGRSPPPPGEPWRIALINGVGTMLGDTLVGSSAMAVVLRRLREQLGRDVVVEAQMAWNSRPGTGAIMGRTPGVARVALHSFTLQELNRCHAYWNFSGLLGIPGYENKPLFDFYLRWFGMDPEQVPGSDKRPVVRLPDGLLEQARTMLAQRAAGRRVVLLQAQASNALRSMPAEQLSHLARLFLERTDLAVMVTQNAPTEVLPDCARVLRMHEWCEGSVDHYTALIGAADALVSVDTFAIHVATALDVPGEVIFTSIEPSLRVAYSPLLRGVLIPHARDLPGWAGHKTDALWPQWEPAYRQAWAALDLGEIVQRVAR